MPNFQSPVDVMNGFPRKVQSAITDTINRIGSTVSAVLDAYMRFTYKVAWPIVNWLNRYGLHVRRYQMTTILSLAPPAVVTGALGYVLGRYVRHK